MIEHLDTGARYFLDEKSLFIFVPSKNDQLDMPFVQLFHLYDRLDLSHNLTSTWAYISWYIYIVRET
jgi:hypothetical protein